MVGFEVLVSVLADKRQEFLHTFKLLTRPDRRSGECLGQKLFEETGNPNRFMWIEYWEDVKSLEAQLKTDRFQSILGAIDVLGTLEDMRTVHFKAL